MKKSDCSIQDAYACLEAGGRVWHGGYPVKIDSWDDKMVFVDCVYDGDVVIVNKDNLTGWTCEWPEDNKPSCVWCRHCGSAIDCDTCDERYSNFVEDEPTVDPEDGVYAVDPDCVCDTCVYDSDLCYQIVGNCEPTNSKHVPKPTVDPGEEYALNAFEWLEEIAEKHGIESYAIPEAMEREIQKLLNICCEHRRKIADEATLSILETVDDIDGNSISWG